MSDSNFGGRRSYRTSIAVSLTFALVCEIIRAARQICRIAVTLLAIQLQFGQAELRGWSKTQNHFSDMSE
jgi:hypothetical protein